MKSIIHNWKDDRCRIILRNCRDALPSGGKLIIVERIIPEPVAADPEARSRAMSDLNMLRGPGGVERTEAEYRTLAESAGFVFFSTSGAGAFSLIQFERVAN
ncbi:methyltransferase [Bradyrhizobium sp. 157]|uniref:methyltransferase n=1 Tax=Bradyrhizobium sp. 157 TaxID=2782631 RepID=UPI001FFBA507|nr:methyltransferase [Bradyrhizobium sp. 157]